MAWAVSAIIGIVRPRSSARIRRVASQPSMTGIFRSIKIRSGVSLSTTASASWPLLASMISKTPIRLSRYTRILRLSRLSSTTRIFLRPIRLPIITSWQQTSTLITQAATSIPPIRGSRYTFSEEHRQNDSTIRNYYANKAARTVSKRKGPAIDTMAGPFRIGRFNPALREPNEIGLVGVCTGVVQIERSRPGFCRATTDSPEFLCYPQQTVPGVSLPTHYTPNPRLSGKRTLNSDVEDRVGLLPGSRIDKRQLRLHEAVEPSARRKSLLELIKHKKLNRCRSLAGRHGQVLRAWHQCQVRARRVSAGRRIKEVGENKRRGAAGVFSNRTFGRCGVGPEAHNLVGLCCTIR